MKQPLWIIISLVVGFLGFMMGYSVPPFMEVGFSGKEHSAGQQQESVEADLLKQYENLYNE